MMLFLLSVLHVSNDPAYTSDQSFRATYTAPLLIRAAVAQLNSNSLPGINPLGLSRWTPKVRFFSYTKICALYVDVWQNLTLIYGFWTETRWSNADCWQNSYKPSENPHFWGSSCSTSWTAFIILILVHCTEFYIHSESSGSIDIAVRWPYLQGLLQGYHNTVEYGICANAPQLLKSVQKQPQNLVDINIIFLVSLGLWPSHNQT
jgi:hypothetical protein